MVAWFLVIFSFPFSYLVISPNKADCVERCASIPTIHELSSTGVSGKKYFIFPIPEAPAVSSVLNSGTRNLYILLDVILLNLKNNRII